MKSNQSLIAAIVVADILYVLGGVLSVQLAYLIAAEHASNCTDPECEMMDSFFHNKWKYFLGWPFYTIQFLFVWTLDWMFNNETTD